MLGAATPAGPCVALGVAGVPAPPSTGRDVGGVVDGGVRGVARGRGDAGRSGGRRGCGGDRDADGGRLAGRGPAAVVGGTTGIGGRRRGWTTGCRTMTSPAMAAMTATATATGSNAVRHAGVCDTTSGRGSGVVRRRVRDRSATRAARATRAAPWWVRGGGATRTASGSSSARGSRGRIGDRLRGGDVGDRWGGRLRGSVGPRRWPSTGSTGVERSARWRSPVRWCRGSARRWPARSRRETVSGADVSTAGVSTAGVSARRRGVEASGCRRGRRPAVRSIRPDRRRVRRRLVGRAPLAVVVDGRGHRGAALGAVGRAPLERRLAHAAQVLDDDGSRRRTRVRQVGRGVRAVRVAVPPEPLPLPLPKGRLDLNKVRDTFFRGSFLASLMAIVLRRPHRAAKG